MAIRAQEAQVTEFIVPAITIDVINVETEGFVHPNTTYVAL